MGLSQAEQQVGLTNRAALENAEKRTSPRVRFPLERKEESVTVHNRDPESRPETQANDDEGVIVKLLF